VKILTPTQFIRQAALKTGTVVTPTPWKEKDPGKKVRKSEANQVQAGEYVGVVMADPPLVDVPDDRCWLCGGRTEGKGQPVKKAIKPTFTDRDKARGARSQSVCAGCAFCLSHLSLRNYSILATEDELKHPSRPEIRGLLLEPPEPPFVMCIAVSGQKWLHFRSQVAYSRDGYPVQYEETRVCVERPVLARWLEYIETLYTVFTKAEILTGSYNQNRIREFGIARFQEAEAQVAPHRGTRLFDLVVFVAQKPPEMPEEQKKEEEKCITTSTQTTPLEQQVLF
jgi:CRISPR type IV-associated protein Csf1